MAKQLTPSAKVNKALTEPISLAFELIDGTFEHNDARELLMQLLDDKINFHHRRNFSWQERFGHHDPHSDNRIAELTMVRERLIQEFMSTRDAQSLRITAKVVIGQC